MRRFLHRRLNHWKGDWCPIAHVNLLGLVTIRQQALPVSCRIPISARRHERCFHSTIFPKSKVTPTVLFTSWPIAASSSTIADTEECGFCTDNSNYLYTELTLNRPTASTKSCGLDLFPQTGLLPYPYEPHTDPKPFCENLFRERATNRKPVTTQPMAAV